MTEIDTDTLSKWILADMDGSGVLILEVHHSCQDGPIFEWPWRVGMSLFPIACPKCGALLASSDARFDFRFEGDI